MPEKKRTSKGHLLKQGHIFGCFCFFICVLTFRVHGQSAYLDYNHWIYDFIERMETRGLFEKFDAGMKPYTRDEIARLLYQIDQQAATHPELLSKSERGLLEQFKGEFSDELARYQIKVNPRYLERHAVRWQEQDNRLFLDFTLRQVLDLRTGDQYPAAERVAETTLGGILRGQFGDNLSFLVEVTNTMRSLNDSTSEHFDPTQGQPLVTTGKRAFSDRAVAYLNWKLPWFTLKFGRDRLKWGPGRRGGLVLSRNNPLFDMILLQKRFKRFNFQYFHGFLNSNFEQKYLVAHRVEWRVTDWFYLSGSETVVYGNRDVEMQYLNPLMPYHVAEHHLGDKDNNMIGCDLSLYPFKNHKYYFELLIDDFSTSESWFSYIGNKFAFMVGGYWTAPFGLTNTDFRVEYARIEPFVYTHYDSVNIYINYDQVMGYWSGPNSDNWYLEANYLLYKDIHLQLTWQQVRRGPEDIYRYPTKADGRRKYFLKGIIERQQFLSFHIRDQLFKDVFLAFRTTLIQTKNLENISGVNSLDKQFTFDFFVNF